MERSLRSKKVSLLHNLVSQKSIHSTARLRVLNLKNNFKERKVIHYVINVTKTQIIEFTCTMH